MEKKIEAWLIVSTLILLGVSVLFVFSTTAIFAEESHGGSSAMVKQHLLHIALGAVVLLLVRKIDPDKLRRIAPYLAIPVLLLLALVLVPGIGQFAGGARRWISIGGVRFQPGELAKLVCVLYFASYIGNNQVRLFDPFRGIFIPFMLLGVVSLLLLSEPDFGSTVIVLLVVFCQFLASGRLKHLGGIALAGIVLVFLAAISSPYRLKRLESFLSPFSDPSRAGYQLIQSLIAVGSGGATGQGLGAGQQKLYYLPASHTDFIFAVIAEELGLVGAIGVVGLFLVIAWQGFYLARRLADDSYLSSLALGCTLLIVVPALLNMGVVIGLFPTKGLVLPLIAYGGTAMIVHLAAVGILLSICRISAVNR